MANKQINARVALKNDFEANWIIAGNNNFIPLKGEEILYNAETDDSPLPVGRTQHIPYNRRKIGDGKRNVNELPFEEEEQFIPIESPDVFVYDTKTGTWTHDPLKSYIITTSNWPELEEGGWHTHQCTYTVGDIVRGEIIGIEEREGQQLYNIKQTIYHSAATFEHYRYFLVAENQLTWSPWYRSTQFPKESNGSIPNYIVALGQSVEQINFRSGMDTIYYSAQSIVEEYGKLSFVSTNTIQNFDETQKQLARDNIGAPTLGANIPDGALLIYNAQTKQITDSGFTIKTFYDKILADIKTWIATEEIIEDNEAGGQTAMYSAPPESVASVANEQGGDTLMIGGIE